jgi:ABC-type dipeptide/oligopeptide/nickel transport systems, permease components
MLALLIKRMLTSIPVLLVVATLTFFLMRAVPGGPFDADKNLPPAIVANLNAKYQLDKPVAQQYVIYLSRLAKGDLGISYKYINRTVSDILSEAIPVSVQLGFTALLLAVIIGVPLGTLAAVNRGSWLDVTAMFISTAGISVPGFVIGAFFDFYIWHLVESFAGCIVGNSLAHDFAFLDSGLFSSRIFGAFDGSECS